MGISFDLLELLEKQGLFLPIGTRVLDIGCSNLYGAEADQISGFICRHRPTPHPRLRGLSELLACGSGYDSVKGGLNDAYVGELLEAAGLQYTALDIFPAFNTLIFDFNRQRLPRQLQSTFDLILNFGTTEHLLNQYNAFNVIHDATKVGGHMVHNLPAVGYVDHGYVTYTGRFFFDLAGFNNYELVNFYHHLPGTTNNIFLPVRSYAGHFPVLKQRIDEIGVTEEATTLDDLIIPDIGFTVIYRKTQDAPFRGALDTSTSTGSVSPEVLSTYGAVDGQDERQAMDDANQVADMSAELSRLNGELSKISSGFSRRIIDLEYRVGSLQSENTTLREQMQVIGRFAWPLRTLRRGLLRLRR